MSGTGEVSVSQKGLSPREDGKKVPVSIFAPETEHAYTEMRVGAESLQGGGWEWVGGVSGIWEMGISNSASNPPEITPGGQKSVDSCLLPGSLLNSADTCRFTVKGASASAQERAGESCTHSLRIRLSICKAHHQHPRTHIPCWSTHRTRATPRLS